MNISGNFTTTPSTIINSITVAIEYMKMTVRTASETFSEEFSGSIAITFDGTAAHIITSMTVSTNFQANGLTYRVENLAISTSSGLDISGRFYHPVHGYVDVTTTSNFTLVSSNPDKYCGGTLQLTGSAGDVIDFTDTSGDCTTYQVCVTPNGGSPSCQSGLVWP